MNNKTMQKLSLQLLNDEDYNKENYPLNIDYESQCSAYQQLISLKKMNKSVQEAALEK
jgi:hypothetical protein